MGTITTIKYLCSDGSHCSNGHLRTRCYSGSSVTSPNPIAVVSLGSNGCERRHIFARCYCDPPVARTSDRVTCLIQKIQNYFYFNYNVIYYMMYFKYIFDFFIFLKYFD
jgi:hypothetical protein